MPSATIPTVQFETSDQSQVTIGLHDNIGYNRETNVASLISAKDDIDAIKAWLAQYTDTKTTFDSYRKEAERLLLWCSRICNKPVSSLTHEDLMVYQHFLADPKPAKDWVMSTKRYARSHPAWRPFTGPLSPASQKQSMIILNGMFNWLVNARYLSGNPLSLSRHRRRSKASPRIKRFLQEDLWNEVKLTINSLPRETIRDREHYHRVRWLFSLFYITGMRISEIIQNDMGCFFARKDQEDDDRWWIEVTGKGNKTRLVPATRDLMLELEHYRREMGLNPYPTEGEPTPLLLPIGGKHAPLSRTSVHLITKEVFKKTADRLKLRGSEVGNKVERLQAASAHWMRHTAGSKMASVMGIQYVRDNLGHESVATTNNYVHTEEDIRHKLTEENHKLNW